ncbi:MAG: hypothetical protein ACYS8W_04205 [Planctomycetota bacterium]|jgi:gas vesicle protein
MSKPAIAVIGFIVGGIIAATVTAAVLGAGHEAEYKVLRDKYDNAVKDKSKLSDELETVREKVEVLEEEKSSLKTELDNLNRALAIMREAAKEPESKPVVAEPEKTEPEPETAELTEEEKKKAEEKKRIMEAIDKLQRIAKIGEPLSEAMIKDLGLDENQAANVSDILKEEGARMLERLREFAATLDEGKTVGDFKGMSGVEISAKIQQHFMDELMKLRELPEEDQKAINSGEKHIVAFVPEDGTFYRILKVFYNERMATYDDLTVHMDEETLEKFKKKYLDNGDFIFPGPASYGTGHINPEDFER